MVQVFLALLDDRGVVGPTGPESWAVVRVVRRVVSRRVKSFMLAECCGKLEVVVGSGLAANKQQ